MRLPICTEEKYTKHVAMCAVLWVRTCCGPQCGFWTRPPLVSGTGQKMAGMQCISVCEDIPCKQHKVASTALSIRVSTLTAFGDKKSCLPILGSLAPYQPLILLLSILTSLQHMSTDCQVSMSMEPKVNDQVNKLAYSCEPIRGWPYLRMRSDCTSVQWKGPGLLFMVSRVSS